MNFLINRKTLALATMILVISAVPNSASARTSIHVDLPHFSIGFQDNHRGKRYRKHQRHHRQHDRYSDRRYDRQYDRRSDRRSDRHYDRRSNDYYSGYGYSAPRSRHYTPRYDNDYCPTPGYSSRYYRNQGCYAHGDHYHCD